jgi:hypothetical protein
VLAGCQGEAPRSEAPGSERVCDPSDAIGDLSQPVELSMVVPGEGGVTEPLADGAEVPLVLAPQGGNIIVVGARARNLVSLVLVTAWLHDEATGEDYGLEPRPARLVETADGWGEPEDPVSSANYAHVAACPAAGLPRDVHDQRWTLVLEVEDCLGAKAEAQVVATPRCLDPEEQGRCDCECSRGYSTADSCGGPEPPDPSPPDGCLDAQAATAPRQHRPMTAQTGSFSLTAEVTPGAGSMDGAVALSSGAVTEWADLAAIVQFRPDGGVAVRDGAGYLETGLGYQLGATYHVRFQVDVAAQSYSAYLTPPAGTEVTLGTGLAFRTPGVTSLDTLAVFADTGALGVCPLSMP